MEKEKRVFSETRAYPIIFMLLVALFFGTLLASFYHSTKERIEENRVLRFKEAVLSVFGLPTDDIELSYQEYITEHSIDELVYYIAQDDTLKLGYCFPVRGNGLWGSISALLAVDNEFAAILAFRILEQNETPGLGGRITEEAFQSQFSGKGFFDGEKIVEYRLIPEDETAGKYEINQITGATSSSQAVVSMIFRNFQTIMNTLEVPR